MPVHVRAIADKNFALHKVEPQHPSLCFKKIGTVWSARVGDRYRALGHDVDGGINWFWIGTHSDYDKLIG
jgi:hypothetical protein